MFTESGITQVDKKYIFIYELDEKYFSQTEGFEFIDLGELDLEDKIIKFLYDNTRIVKLMVVKLEDVYKVPIGLYKRGDAVHE